MGGEGGGAAGARGIYAASVCDVRGCLEKLDAMGWRTLKRRERRGPDVKLQAWKACRGHTVAFGHQALGKAGGDAGGPGDFETALMGCGAL